MLRRVRLDRLPDELTFPPQLAERIAYDPRTRQLCFEGFMSKVDFDKLVRLHNDAGYQRAIEELFQICTFDDDTQSSGPLRVTMAGAAALLLTGMAVGMLLLR